MASVEVGAGHGNYLNQQGSCVMQDGRMIAHWKTGSTVTISYSDDDAATWSDFTTSVGGVSGINYAMNNIKGLDDYIVVNFKDGSSDSGIRIYSVGATNITQVGAEKEYELSTGNFPSSVDAFYHSGDDTIYVLVVYPPGSDGDTYTFECWPFDLTAETWGSATSTATDIFTAAADRCDQVSLIIETTDGDGYTTEAYPNFWLHSQFDDGDVRLQKGTRVTGATWSISSTTVMGTGTSYGNTGQSFWDGTRLVVAWADGSGDIVMKERNSANTTTTDRTPGTEPTGGPTVPVAIGAGWGGGNRDVYVVSTTAVSNGDQIYAKYDRSGDSWDSAYTVAESANHGQTNSQQYAVFSNAGGALNNNKLFFHWVTDTFASNRTLEVAEVSFGPSIADTTLVDTDTLNADTLQPWVITGTTLVDSDTLNVDVLQPMRITGTVLDDSTDTFNTDLLSRVITGTTLDDSADTFNADTLMYGFPDNEFIEVDVLNLDTFYRIFDTDTFIDDSTDTFNADQLVQGLIEGTFLTDGDTLNLDTLYFTLITANDLNVSPVWMYQLVRRGGSLYHAPMRPSYGWSGDDVVSSPFRYNTAYEDYLNKVIHATWIWHNEDATATLKALMNTALGTAGFEDQAGDVLT